MFLILLTVIFKCECFYFLLFMGFGIFYYQSNICHKVYVIRIILCMLYLINILFYMLDYVKFNLIESR